MARVKIQKNTITTYIKQILQYAHEHVNYLNSSKFFAGIVMLILNIGSKFVTVQLSKSTEEYVKYTVGTQLLVFAMAWMGTRDIYAAIVITASFTILSEFLFNEESKYCVVPDKYRMLNKVIDTNGDGIITESEINSAIAILEKAKKNKKAAATGAATGTNGAV